MVIKHNTYRWMVLLWVLIHSTLSFAYDVEVNGIYYNLNTNLRKAEVTNGTTKYRGIVDIPATINDGGTTYSVTNIGKSAFEGCANLSSIEILSHIRKIDDKAFYLCLTTFFYIVFTTIICFIYLLLKIHNIN